MPEAKYNLATANYSPSNPGRRPGKSHPNPRNLKESVLSPRGRERVVRFLIAEALGVPPHLPLLQEGFTDGFNGACGESPRPRPACSRGSRQQDAPGAAKAWTDGAGTGRVPS